jgi:hypothetical protein
MRPMRMTRALALAALLVAGCKGKSAPEAKRSGSAGSGSGSGSAGATGGIDWRGCEAALKKAASAPLNDRPKIVIDGCKVCGDWDPLLRWNTPPGKGGPRREAIEATLVSCKAFCSGDAKLKFMGTLDDARGSTSRTPWRQLATICKDEVSAVPDQRFMNAPYLALDRIARAAAARNPIMAELAGAFELPLPAVSLVGTGVALPVLDRNVSADIGPVQLTVLGDSVQIGVLPIARLGANGVAVSLGMNDYPGKVVKITELQRELENLVGEQDKSQTLTLLAPASMPVRRLVPIIEIASKVTPVHLGARALAAPEGWDLVGAIPIDLEVGGDNPLAVSETMTVQDLARAAEEQFRQDQYRIGITAK